MASAYVLALVSLATANEACGLDPQVAFIRAFAQVLSATLEDLELLGQSE